MKRFAVVFAFLAALAALGPAPACAASKKGTPVTIFYTSDTHGYVASDDRRIGLDRVATIKKSTPASLLLDAGDFLQGTPMAAMTRGRDIISLMKEAGFFAAAVGNHEFTYGLAALMERKAEAEAAPNPMHLLSANTYSKGELLFTPWTEASVNGARICIFGLTTPETRRLVDPAIVGGLTFAEAGATASATAGKMRASGCDAVIALTHLGSGEKIPMRGTELPAIAPEIDVVIDGHSHIVVDRKVGRSLVVSPGAHARRLGRLDLVLDTRAHRVLRAKNTLLTARDVADQALDPSVTAMLKAVQRNLEHLDTPVGVLKTGMSGLREAMRTRETTLGNFTADALRAAYSSDFAVVNGGGIRAGLPQGTVTRKDVLTVFPFTGNVVLLSITGRDVLSLLEHGFARLPEADGAFPQISGLAVTINSGASRGKRVLSATLPDGSRLDPGKTYTLATNNYMAAGGDGYVMLKGKKQLRSDVSVEDAVSAHIRTHGNTFSPAGQPPRISDTRPKPAL